MRPQLTQTPRSQGGETLTPPVWSAVEERGWIKITGPMFVYFVAAERTEGHAALPWAIAVEHHYLRGLMDILNTPTVTGTDPGT